MNRKIKDIIKSDLCLGCGLCQSISEGRSQMFINDKGFYEPKIEMLNEHDKAVIANICPGINVDNTENKSRSLWGKSLMAVNAWATDTSVRHSSSSGGVTSALAIYLLESKKIDGVLQVGVEEESYLCNKLYVSKSREDVLKCNSSRYAPAPLFNDITNILDSNPNSIFAFCGKPCDIAGIKNLIKVFPKYKNQIRYFLSIFCAGMPSYNATEKALDMFCRNEKPQELRYRGDGWPGYFTATYSDGTKSQMTYNDSWGKILGRQLGFRCKICPDSIGMLADISSGDSWKTKNGYPDFTESDGMNFCFLRTKQGKELFLEAESAGYITVEKLKIEDVKTMQRYQYDRRQYVGWRIVVTQIATGGILCFKNLGYYHNALHSNIIKGIKQAIGTYKRLKRN